MVLVIELKQQKQLFHVKSAKQTEVTFQVHLCRKAVHSNSLETVQCMRTDCNSVDLTNIQVVTQIIALN